MQRVRFLPCACGGRWAAPTTGCKPYSPPIPPEPGPVDSWLCFGGAQRCPHLLSPSVLSEIFPYLVVVIGLENVLVLTKSVVSTPVDLEVKLRIAQGNAVGSRGAPGWGAIRCSLLLRKRSHRCLPSLTPPRNVGWATRSWQLVSACPEGPWHCQTALCPGSHVRKETSQTLLRGSRVW